MFDISYNGKIMYGSREIPNLTWRMYHRISFKDGTADVYIYEGTADKYFNILMVFLLYLESRRVLELLYLECMRM